MTSAPSAGDPHVQSDSLDTDVEAQVLEGVDNPLLSLQNQATTNGSGVSQENYDNANRPHRGRYEPRHSNYRLSREELRQLADVTLDKLDSGSYVLPESNELYDLESKIDYTNNNTSYYDPEDLDIADWQNADLGVTEGGGSTPRTTQIAIREYSTLVGARKLHALLQLYPEVENKKIGVLNFASAKKPGGGFMNGSQAQEESIARTSTLYPSLICAAASEFYNHYKKDPDNSFYTHAMIYSPSVVVFRNDIGHWMRPIEIDVLTSAAVNAGEVRERVQWEEDLRMLKQRLKTAEQITKEEEEHERQEEALRQVLQDSVDDVDMADISGDATPLASKVGTTDDIPQPTLNGINSPPSNDTDLDVKYESKLTPTDTDPLLNPDPPLEAASPPPELQPEISDDPFHLAELKIDVQMYERTGRLLYLFHKRGAKHLILGSFGTGVFQNRIELVAGIFYDLLVSPNAKFKNVFDTVIFAILGRYTVRVFEDMFGNEAVKKLHREDEVVDEIGSQTEGVIPDQEADVCNVVEVDADAITVIVDKDGLDDEGAGRLDMETLDGSDAPADLGTVVEGTSDIHPEPLTNKDDAKTRPGDEVREP